MLCRIIVDNFTSFFGWKCNLWSNGFVTSRLKIDVSTFGWTTGMKEIYVSSTGVGLTLTLTEAKHLN